MPTKINIVTPCSRPNNLGRIARSILRGLVNHGWPIEVRWWIVFDTNRLDQNKINEACLNISDGQYWVLSPTVLLNQSKGSAGHQHRNLVLDFLEKRNEDGWFYSVDDDNILHEKFYEVIRELKEDLTAVAVNQILKNGKPNCSPVNKQPLKAMPENMKTYFVDTAQVIFNLKKMKGVRFDESQYKADGMLIEELFEKEGGFAFIDKDLSYYNFLKCNETRTNKTTIG